MSKRYRVEFVESGEVVEVDTLAEVTPVAAAREGQLFHVVNTDPYREARKILADLSPDPAEEAEADDFDHAGLSGSGGGLSYRVDGARLIIEADADKRAELAEWKADNPDAWDSERTLCDAFEDLTCNSDLEWINPGNTGDLTDAPMLGILGEVQPDDSGPFGAVLAGRWEDAAGVSRVWHHPIVARWAYMDYQVRNPLDDLLESGRVVFTS